MQQWYLGLYAQDTWKLSPKATRELRVALGTGLRAGASQRRDSTTSAPTASSRGEKTTQYSNCAARIPVSGRSGFANGKAGHEQSPAAGGATGRVRVGSERRWPHVDPHGIRLSYDFVNAQFHLNTSVAPPFNAEARVDSPVGGFDDPLARHRQRDLLPIHHGKDSPFPLTGPYISIPPDILPPRQQSWNVSFQRQVGENVALSASYLGSHSIGCGTCAR
jgi:hypothetical protein